MTSWDLLGHHTYEQMLKTDSSWVTPLEGTSYTPSLIGLVISTANP